MEWVKSFGGIALLGVGIYFLRPIIPALRKATDPGMAFLLGSIVVGAIGLALGAIHLSFHDRAAIKARKGLAVVLTVVGITGVVNWSLTPPSVLPWQHDEVVAFDMAKQSDRGVMIDFSAEWCLPCKELETKTFSAFEVRERVTDGFVPLKFDVTEDSDEDEELKERYDAENLPAVIFLDAEGKELGRVNKFLPPDEFISAMDKMQAPRQASR
jgi:thiol:disulfide interchange protein DsbD